MSACSTAFVFRRPYRFEDENDADSDDGCPKAKKHDPPRVPDVYKNKSAAEGKSVTVEVDKSTSSNQTDVNHAAVTETTELIPATTVESSSQKEKQPASDKRVQDNSRPIPAVMLSSIKIYYNYMFFLN